MTIGKRIKNRRTELGLSVDTVADMLHKNKATIYRYESDEIENLPITVLEPLAKILQTTPAYLMGWETEEGLDYALISKRLQEIRMSKHLSLDKFAIRLGLTELQVQDFENNKAEITESLLKTIAHEFNISFNWLKDGTGSLYEYDSLLLQVAEKYDLNEYEQMILNKYLTFDDRSTIIRFLQDIKKGEEDLLNDINEEAATYDLPLLGKTAAGEPLSYSDTSYENISVHAIPHGAEFALCVSGDSMEPTIKDGSLVFVMPQPVAENGEIVIAEVDGAVTCKKFYKYGGKIELRSINPKYEPITEFENFRIIGKVIL